MFFLYTLSALCFITAVIFLTPLRAKVWTALALIVAATAALSVKAVGVLAGGGTCPLWAFDSPVLGCDTGSLDPLSAFFVLLISIGAVAATLYSHGYLAHALEHKSPTHISLHYTALAIMSLSMPGVVASDGGYSFLFFWELMTVASFILILFDAERREVRRAALSYLIMMHIGFVLLVVGFVRLHAATGSASFAALDSCFAAQPFLPLFLVFLAGFGMKAGLFPMHVWLPEAHPAAPSHVSALMSGVMIKTGVYGILRIATAPGDPAALGTAGTIVLALGIATGLWGVILAASQNDVKRLLAYSSIENVGVILIGVGIALLGKAAGNPTVAACGMTGALLHTLNHSFFKSLLFFGAGNVLTQTHTTSLDALGGAARHMPLTAMLFLAGSAAICALPPLNGFVSELAIYLGLFKGIAAGTATLASAAALVALAMIGGIVVLAFTKLYGTVFLGAPRSHSVAEASEVDGWRIAAMALPLAGILFVGLFPATAMGIIIRAAAFFLPAPAAAEYLLTPVFSAVGRTAWLLLLVIGLLAWLRSRTLRGRTVAEGPTWGCGFTAPNVRMQYTGESFSEGLQSIAPSLTQQKGEGDAVGKSEIFPSAHGYDIRRKDRIDNFFTAWWVELLHLINQRVMSLRTGKINRYILFALAFLGLVFFLSIFHLL